MAAAPRIWWRLELAYDGTPFDGWARQPGRRTVRGRARGGAGDGAARAGAAACRRAHRRGRARAGPGRSFATAPATLDATPPAPAAERPAARRDLGHRAWRRRRPGFDARAAAARTYRYRLWLPDTRPVFERLYVWDVRGGVDPDLLDAAAALLAGPPRLLGPHAVGALLPHLRARGRRAPQWRLAADGREARFEITAGSFLHNMVRVAVGSMVDVAQGRMSLARALPPASPAGAAATSAARLPPVASRWSG